MTRNPHVIPLVTLITVFVFATGAALFMSAQTVHAEIEGNCTAAIDGVDVSLLDSGSRSDDIEVSNDASIIVGALSPVGFESHKIQLEFGSTRWTVSEEDDNGSNSWVGTVNVADYATWGVGLYKVIGVSTLSDGTTCTGAATVDVEGNPLTTVAGGIAAGTVLVGTVAAAASVARSASGPFSTASNFIEEAFSEHQADRAQRGSEARDQEAEEARRRRAADDQSASEQGLDMTNARLGMALAPMFGQGILGCACMAALGLVMLPLLALTGGGTGGSSAPGESEQQPASGDEPPRGLPRAPWRPRITLLGLVSGFLAGAGIVVLLQQYSIQYPTLGVIITWVLISMAVYGVVLPTLGYTIGWLRINGRISRLEQELQ